MLNIDSDPARITLDDYQTVIDALLAEISSYPAEIQPDIIIHNGSVSTPGVSDIDLLIGFEDNSTQGGAFFNALQASIAKMPHKDIFFPHMPYFFSKSTLADLPLFTVNDRKDMRCLKGDIDFISPQSMDAYQAALLNLEFISFRLAIELIPAFLTGRYEWSKALLHGHTMVHSLNLQNMFKPDEKMEDYKGVSFIEKLRGDIRAATKKSETFALPDEAVLPDLYQLLIMEFYKVLKNSAAWLESKVDFFTCPQVYHEYTNEILFVDMFSDKEQAQITVEDFIKVQGMPWMIALCAAGCFPEYYDNARYQINDPLFEEALKKRGRFHAANWEWNMRNFGIPDARYTLNPLVFSNKHHEVAQVVLGKGAVS